MTGTPLRTVKELLPWLAAGTAAGGGLILLDRQLLKKVLHDGLYGDTRKVSMQLSPHGWAYLKALRQFSRNVGGLKNTGYRFDKGELDRAMKEMRRRAEQMRVGGLSDKTTTVKGVNPGTGTVGEVAFTPAGTKAQSGLAGLFASTVPDWTVSSGTRKYVPGEHSFTAASLIGG